jgi:hypothetical protein
MNNYLASEGLQVFVTRDKLPLPAGIAQACQPSIVADRTFGVGVPAAALSYFNPLIL